MFQSFKTAVAGAQILFVAFGAMVLVPLLTGLNPAMALLGAGIGTLLFQALTGRKVPIFLGSSFAFIAPIIYAMQEWGMGGTMFGLFAAGFMYFVFAALIKYFGLPMVSRLLPPVVIGPVIMVIGLSVAVVASNMAMGQAGGNQVLDYTHSLLLSGFTFAVTVMVAVFGSKMMKLVPILIGVAAGYLMALAMGMVDTAPIAAAPWFAVPHFHSPQVNWQAALFMLPVAIAPAIEHIGGIMAIGKVTGKDYAAEPGLHRTLAGDGRVRGRPDRRPAGNHLWRGNGRGNAHQKQQSGHHDLGGHLRHLHGIFRQIQCFLGFDSAAGDGWGDDSAVRHDCFAGAENANRRAGKPDAAEKPGDCELGAHRGRGRYGNEAGQFQLRRRGLVRSAGDSPEPALARCAARRLTRLRLPENGASEGSGVSAKLKRSFHKLKLSGSLLTNSNNNE